MPAKRLTGGQYYIEVEVANNVTSRFIFSNKEIFEQALKHMKNEGDKIIAQGEY